MPTDHVAVARVPTEAFLQNIQDTTQKAGKSLQKAKDSMKRDGTQIRKRRKSTSLEISYW
jgi:hypothetical protein